MSAQRIQYRPETVGFIDAAPVRAQASLELPCSAQRLFAIFEDADAWTRWAGLAWVRWTSAPPFGAGTTRTVKLGPIEVDEVFTDWREGEQMTFYFASGTAGLLAAGVEDYRVTALGEERCALTWRMGIETRGAARLLDPIVSLIMRRTLTRSLAQLAATIRAGADKR